MDLAFELKVLAKTVIQVFKDNAMDLASVTLIPAGQKFVRTRLPESRSPWITDTVISKVAVDGATRGSLLVPNQAGAKFAMRKGLPNPDQKRTLAIENDPHVLEGFSGVIKEGYGKGTKTLLWSGRAILKVKGETKVTDVEYHVHQADKAGLHYDLAVKELKPGEELWELNIPNGDYRGRYAFVQTERGLIATLMNDYSVLEPKPDYKLVKEAIFDQVDRDNAEEPRWLVERKVDGSMGVANFKEDRAIFRSHREEAKPYYDKLPALEFVNNKSHYFCDRTLFPGPGLHGTILMGELVHPDGVGRVSGVLNATAPNARSIQSIRGPVKFEAWDIAKLRGKDLSAKPYAVRRELLEQTIKDIRHFNKNWSVIERKPDSMSTQDFYNRVVSDPRGLPYSEGIVIKDLNDPRGETWMKVKTFDEVDLEIIGFKSGGLGTKYSKVLGSFTCRDPRTGNTVEVGTGMSDYTRKFAWKNRDALQGAVIKANAFEATNDSFRAPRFIGFHQDPRFGKIGSEEALMEYAEGLAGGDPAETNSMIYRLKASAGWRAK
jgi:hypothetical protein